PDRQAGHQRFDRSAGPGRSRGSREHHCEVARTAAAESREVPDTAVRQRREQALGAIAAGLPLSNGRFARLATAVALQEGPAIRNQQVDLGAKTTTQVPERMVSRLFDLRRLRAVQSQDRVGIFYFAPLAARLARTMVASTSDSSCPKWPSRFSSSSSC